MRYGHIVALFYSWHDPTDSAPHTDLFRPPILKVAKVYLLWRALHNRHSFATLGFISVLHTWNQKLIDHFHLHCIIPGGVLSFDKTKWTAARDKYLFKVESLAKEFRKRYLHKLESAYGQEKICFHGRASDFADQQIFTQLINTLKDKQWLDYSKQPFEVSLRSLIWWAGTGA